MQFERVYKAVYFTVRRPSLFYHKFNATGGY